MREVPSSAISEPYPGRLDPAIPFLQAATAFVQSIHHVPRTPDACGMSNIRHQTRQSQFPPQHLGSVSVTCTSFRIEECNK